MNRAVLALSLALGLSLQAPVLAYASAEVVSGADTELKIEAGKGRLLRLSRPAATVFMADPKIADVQVKSPTLVYLVGKAPGSTSFFAMDGKEQMIANLSVSVGLDEARLRDMLRQQVPDSHIEVTAANGALILSGKVASQADGDDALRIAGLFLQAGGPSGGAQIVNRLTVETPNQVNLRVRIAEVSRTASNQLGFNWESLAGVGDGGGFVGWATGADIVKDRTIVRPAGEAGAIVAGILGQDVNINLLIDALARQNLVSILAEPNLTAVSGEPAEFLAGGEFPVPVPGDDEKVTIDYKKYGVSLSFVATILDSGRISLTVRPEVSQLTEAGSITVGSVRVPGLSTRRAETTVDLGSGQSFAIAGLIQNNVMKDMRRLPGIGDVPVLGELFRSRAFQKNESELVIIVTPYLVKPVSKKLAAPTDRLAPVAAAAPVTTPATETRS